MINLSRIIRDGGRIVATSALLLASSSVADLCCGRADRPQISPACHPTWGYYQTCWRRFPPLEPCVGWGDTCDVCPPQGTVIHQGQPVQGPVRIIGPQLQTHPHMKMGQPPVILQPFGGGGAVNQIPPGAIVIPQSQSPQPTPQIAPLPELQGTPGLVQPPGKLPIDPVPLNESALPAAPPLQQQSFRYQHPRIQQMGHGKSSSVGGHYIGHQMNVQPVQHPRRYPTGTWQAPVTPEPEPQDNSFTGRLKRWFRR